MKQRKTNGLTNGISQSTEEIYTPTHPPQLAKMAAILQTIDSNAFALSKILYFDSDFTEACS